MFCCYILFSKKLNRYYVGACHNDLSERIKKHNEHFYGNLRFTSRASDWELFLTLEVSDYPEATRIEKHIKAMKSKIYIENLKKYPEMTEKLKNKYKSIRLPR
ncbi:MAG: GIY-YIG nuclease family protein [Bacteroidota bacterium]